MRFTRVMLAAMTATMTAGTALHAQATPAGADDGRMSPRRTEQGGVALGVFGGGTIPVGDTRDRAPTGWNVGAYVDLGRHVGPFGVRLEGAYHGFGDSDVLTTAGTGTTFSFANKYSIAHAGAALVFGIPATWTTVRPYVVGGVGAYWLRNAPQCVAGGAQSCPPGDARLSVAEDWRLGLNGGGGIEFGIGNASAFVEARYHHALRGLPSASCLREGTCTDRSPAQLVPINAGLIFRF